MGQMSDYISALRNMSTCNKTPVDQIYIILKLEMEIFQLVEYEYFVARFVNQKEQQDFYRYVVEKFDINTHLQICDNQKRSKLLTLQLFNWYNEWRTAPVVQVAPPGTCSVDMLDEIKIQNLSDPTLHELVLNTIAEYGMTPSHKAINLRVVIQPQSYHCAIAHKDDFVSNKCKRLYTNNHMIKSTYVFPCLYNGPVYKNNNKNKCVLVARVSTPILIKAAQQMFPREFANVDLNLKDWRAVCCFLHKDQSTSGLVNGLMSADNDVNWDVLLKASASIVSRMK